MSGSGLDRRGFMKRLGIVAGAVGFMADKKSIASAESVHEVAGDLAQMNEKIIKNAQYGAMSGTRRYGILPTAPTDYRKYHRDRNCWCDSSEPSSITPLREGDDDSQLIVPNNLNFNPVFADVERTCYYIMDGSI